MKVYITDNLEFLNHKEYFDENHTIIIAVKNKLLIPEYNVDVGEALDFRSDSALHTDIFDVYKIPLGVKWYAPRGVFMFLLPRSSSYKNFNIRLANTIGLIDSSYRNEIKVLIEADNPHYPITIERGDKIVQGLILRTAMIDTPAVKEIYFVVNEKIFNDWENIMESARKGGFGWTGKK